jgi:hypothetical protein
VHGGCAQERGHLPQGGGEELLANPALPEDILREAVRRTASSCAACWLVIVPLETVSGACHLLNNRRAWLVCN